ncbi:hypothetical protein ES708_16734 [subsurface metagenome]
MENEQGTDRALTWADEFIKDLLADTEKHQDTLRDLSDEAIRSTINKLDTTSSEFLAGLNVLTYKADLEIKSAFAEAEEQIGEQAFSALTLMATGITETDDETWERIFDIDKKLDTVKNEVEAEDTVRDEYRAYLEQDVDHLITYWTDQATEATLDLLTPMMSLMIEGIVTMIPAAISALFSEFMDAFFEEA